MNNSVLFRKGATKNPCYQCPDRSAECHAKCERWAEYEAKRNERYAMQKKQREFNEMMGEIECHRIEVSKKFKGRRRR